MRAVVPSSPSGAPEEVVQRACVPGRESKRNAEGEVARTRAVPSMPAVKAEAAQDLRGKCCCGGCCCWWCWW